MREIKILIVDDNLVIRQGLRSLLDDEEGIVVKGEASTGSEAIRWMKKASADVVLMDIRMPVINGIAATAGIVLNNPEARILIITVTEDSDILAEAMNAGAKGYLIYNRFEPDELIQAIHMVASGATLPVSNAVEETLGKIVSGDGSRLESESPALGNLTKRENQILELIADGNSNAEIAKALDIGEKTIKNHITSLYAKLKISSRYEAIRLRLQHNS